MALDASNRRQQGRTLSPRALGAAIGIGGSLAGGLLGLASFTALGRESPIPGIVLGTCLLLAWGLAVAFGMAAAARQRASRSGEERRRLEAELAELTERARLADSLSREVNDYRRLFETADPVPPRTASPIRNEIPAAPDGMAPRGVPAAAVATPKMPVPRPAARPPLEDSGSHALRDPLTGLFHHRYFESCLGREIHRMERRNMSLGILLLEVDAFDAFQKAEGQENAETLLRTLAELLKRRVRGGDVACYNGQGEFGLLLPEAPLEGVRARAEQLRAAVKELRARGGDDAPASFTLSLGVAAYPDSGLAFDKIQRALRSALEQSRREGGDRVSIAPAAVLDRRLMLPD